MPLSDALTVRFLGDFEKEGILDKEKVETGNDASISIPDDATSNVDKSTDFVEKRIKKEHSVLYVTICLLCMSTLRGKSETNLDATLSYVGLLSMLAIIYISAFRHSDVFRSLEELGKNEASIACMLVCFWFMSALSSVTLEGIGDLSTDKYQTFFQLLSSFGVHITSHHWNCLHRWLDLHK